MMKFAWPCHASVTCLLWADEDHRIAPGIDNLECNGTHVHHIYNLIWSKGQVIVSA
jgi:hypothetical protein